MERNFLQIFADSAPAAQSRTNMVSLLDVGTLGEGKTEKLVEMGNGYTELTEDWGPKVDSKQYVNMEAESAVVSGYSFSMSPQREYISDDLQKAIDDLSKTFPVGSKCNTFYYRFYKTDLTAGEGTMSGSCIKVPVVVTISSVGGSGGESLKSTIQIKGNGNVSTGTVTVGTDGAYTFAAA